jgi:tripartite ATP-independent transporter DctM subunit
MAYLALLMFAVLFLLILKGYPVAFTLGGIATLIGIYLMYFQPEYFQARDFHLLGSRMMGVMSNYVLMAVPLFIFMGIMLERSGLARDMLNTMAGLMAGVPGGLAIAVVLVGALLAASTGIVGATVVTMGMISLPTMLEKGYAPSYASGTIAASGTLGQIIPPSIVLVILADTMSNASRSNQVVDVGSIFAVALLPGLILVGLYIVYVSAYAYFRPAQAPSTFQSPERQSPRRILKAFVLPLSLILLVLGSIFAGIASPTEAAAIGALGTMVLTYIQRDLSIPILRNVSRETAQLTAMIFFILLGATTFSLLFRSLGGDEFLIQSLQNANLSGTQFLIITMLLIFILGFFIDFIEIIFILVPIITPLFEVYDMNLLWVGILIALNLQTSFLTPPFGFSLFYLKGVAPPYIKTKDIYRGVIPFVLIQIIFISIIVGFPEWFTL